MSIFGLRVVLIKIISTCIMQYHFKAIFCKKKYEKGHICEGYTFSGTLKKVHKLLAAYVAL